MPTPHVQVHINLETGSSYSGSPGQEQATFTKHFMCEDSHKLKFIIQIFSIFGRVHHYVPLLSTLCVRIHPHLKITVHVVTIFGNEHV